MFESTLNAKRLCLKTFKLRGGFCVMVNYITYVSISSQTVSYSMSMWVSAC